MRILVVSNFYPPHHIGGYELGCYEAVEGLKKRGHEVTVLTSNYGLPQFTQEGHVYRYLQTYMGQGFSSFELLKKELHNQHEFKKIVHLIQPEVVYFWNLWQVSLSLVYLAEHLGLPICYYIFDHSLAEWGNLDDWFYRWGHSSTSFLKTQFKQLFRPLLHQLNLETKAYPVNFNQAQFASYFLKEQALKAGQPVGQAKVIHWGLDSSQFPYRQTVAHPLRRLLYVGQLVAHKGVHTIIEALKLLKQEYSSPALELTIVGGTVTPDYLTQLKKWVQFNGLTAQIHFTGPLPRAELPAIYQTHDIMLVPSQWDEPFGLILLEAMASGLGVVGTATGGSAEILQHQVNGLVFPKGDTVACAACILELVENPQLYQRLRQQGRCTVEQQFPLNQTLDRIEQALQEVIQ